MGSLGYMGPFKVYGALYGVNCALVSDFKLTYILAVTVTVTVTSA
jgi:hypothetical protein